jgi:hypothetical protein
MRQRIDHLEELVKKLITEHHETAPPRVNLALTPESPKADAGSDTAAPVSNSRGGTGTGKTVVDGIHSAYLDANDWHTVLQEVFSLPLSLP